jgi:predicted nucleotidyltransferase
MPVNNQAFTPYPEADDLLHELQVSIGDIFGNRLTGMYLDGSLASGDFDEDSDIDFVVVVEDEISEDTFLALGAMHERLAEADSLWAINFEGSYISRRAVRRFDPSYTLYPNIERGRGEKLKMARHDQTWDIHRWVLCERGIVLAGPAARELVEPVLPEQLRQASLTILTGWAANILNTPEQMHSRGYQSYTVLTICRILYTLENSAVASKPTAARWSQEMLGERWSALIARAWDGRHNPGLACTAEEVNTTLDMIRFALERSL